MEKKSVAVGAAEERTRIRPHAYCKWGYCRWCWSVIKLPEVNRHVLVQSRGTKSRGHCFIVSNGECMYCGEVVRHTENNPCKKRLFWLISKALSGTCSDSVKDWILGELVCSGSMVALEIRNDHGLLKMLLDALKHSK